LVGKYSMDNIFYQSKWKIFIKTNFPLFFFELFLEVLGFNFAMKRFSILKDGVTIKGDTKTT
jgi:hypothetical protein